MSCEWQWRLLPRLSLSLDTNPFEQAGLDVVESVERTQELGRRLIAELTSAQDNG